MSIHILVDWKDNGKFFLENELDKIGISYITHHINNYNMADREKKYRIIILYLKYLRLSLQAILKSNKNDLLICWNFTTAITTGILCIILFQKRIVLGLNIIAHKRKGLGEKIRRLLFSPIMNMKSFFATVNSDLYIKEYSYRFKVQEGKFFVLNDPIYNNELKDFNPKKTYVFAGGEAQRDWQTLFKACSIVPEIKFVCVARKKYFDPQITIPANVKLHFDINHELFYELMEKSTLVVIPLKSKLPSGLIILLRAALIQKPIIATRTPSILNYIKEGKRGLLVEQGDFLELSNKIRILYNDTKLQKNLTTNLTNFVLTNHSQKSYTEQLIDITKKVEHKYLYK
jgi:glycosyltransferase involved in cell wall biosynthesis